MLIDAFLGFDELNLASFRIQYLSEMVDKTIIFESNKTHSGLSKPLFFKDWYLTLDLNIKNKILIVEIDLSDFTEAWDREIASREYAMNYLRNNFMKEKFILSDIDEIPSQFQLRELIDVSGLFHFKSPTYYRKINWALRDNHCSWSRGVMGEVSKATYPNGARFTKNLPTITDNPGAHLSYLGFDAKKLENKLISFAHTELVNAKNEAHSIINISDNFGLDHLGRFYSQGFGLLRVANPNENDVVKFAKNFFPQDFYNFSKFGHNLPKRLYKSAVLTTYYNKSGMYPLDNLPRFAIIKTILKGTALGIRRLFSTKFR